MSNLRPPGLGPIVGHTTDTTARLWIKATDLEDHGANIASHRRTIGVVAVTRENGQPVSKQVHYFRLRREYDRTGTFTLGEDTGLEGENPSAPLKPSTRYEARLGTLTIDDPFPDEDSIPSKELVQRLPEPHVWWNELLALPEDLSLATFTTFSKHDNHTSKRLTFLVGSCRYPGLVWPQTKHSDAIFGSLLEEARGKDKRKAAEFVLMVGDQIYADMLNQIPIGRADTFQEFQDRYIQAFGSRRMRKLLRNIPTYMILDDHEIEDNWTRDRICKADKRALFNWAIKAYMSYQWVHGPTCFGKRLFYHFACGGYPFFVLDTRTQRFMDDVAGSLDDNHLLGRPGVDGDEPSQLDVLLRWLRECQEQQKNTPKFIVSSSVFVPNPISAREGRQGKPEHLVKWKEQSDSWPAFPNTRQAILKTIITHNIQNVIFISGDIHCSNVAAIRFSGSPAAEKLKAAAITSSAFYWPFCFADGEPSNFVHNSTAKGQKDTFDIDDAHKMNYKAWNFTQEDNFCRVDVEPDKHRLVVRPFDTDGNAISKGSWLDDWGVSDGQSLVSKLKLEPW